MDLRTAYLRTRYEVEYPAAPFVLTIGEPSPELLVCHRDFGVTCSAFLSAWNPLSQRADRATNDAAHRRLRRTVTSLGMSCVEGWGRDPAGEWEAEQSLWVPGLDAELGGELGKMFQQNAIVVAGEEAVPRLVWTAA